MLPHFLVFRSRVLSIAAFRSLAVWAAIRVFLWVSSGNDLQLSAKSTLLLAAIAASVAFIEARRRHEMLWLQNLGVGTVAVPITAASTSLLAEFLVFLVSRGAAQ